MPEEAKTPPAPFLGRRRIYTSADHIGLDNIREVFPKALATHAHNAGQISYLWRYYKGYQPVLDREKQGRTDICNNVVENHAQECVQFKVGYQFAEPIQYVPRSAEDDVPDGHERSENGLVNRVRILNDLLHDAGKASSDRDLFEWMCVCGVGYRLVTAVPEAVREDGGAPFAIYTADPRCAFVIRSSEYHRRVMAGVWVGMDEDTGNTYYTVYTDSEVLTCCQPPECDGTWRSEPNPNGVMIFEYELNNDRMGVFEPALPLLDAINTVVSNRVDGVEQNIQAITVFDNVDIDSDTFDAMMAKKAIKTRSVEGCQGRVYNLEYENDQTQTQVTKQDLYDAFANITGMPNMTNKTGSSSDTGTAVLLRDGWTLAESHAKSYELKWKTAERPVLALILSICRTQGDGSPDLRVRDVDMNFNRRNYENTLVKAQTLTTMLAESRIDPELAFEVCGLFTDPTSAYLQSLAHYEEEQQKAQERAEQIAGIQAQQQQQNAAEPPSDGSQDGQNAHNDAVAKVSAANRIAEGTGVHPRG